MGNVIDIGTDIIEIERIRSGHKRYGAAFLERIFTPGEMEYCHRFSDPHPHIAVRFAAKEAVIKAITTLWNKPISWHNISIHNLPSGKPEVVFGLPIAEALKEYKILITLSHSREYATATAILIKQ
ncbi:MAG: holo-ACP synthase [Chlamydiia bacterium]|nr:holo-ACP synthase [Chlamydiia bacterium]